MDIPHRREEKISEIEGVIQNVVADGYGRHFAAGVERYDVVVEPPESIRTVGSDGRNQGVGDVEEEGDVGVGEVSDDGRVRFRQPYGGESESMEGGDDIVWSGAVVAVVVVVGGVVRVGDADDRKRGGAAWEREKGEREKEKEKGEERGGV